LSNFLKSISWDSPFKISFFLYEVIFTILINTVKKLTQLLVLSFLNKGNATRDEEEARKGERRLWKGAGGRRRGKGEGVRGRRMSMEKGTERGKGDGVKGRRKRERGRRGEGREKMGKEEEKWERGRLKGKGEGGKERGKKMGKTVWSRKVA
jgi:hypothetical protein